MRRIPRVWPAVVAVLLAACSSTSPASPNLGTPSAAATIAPTTPGATPSAAASSPASPAPLPSASPSSAAFAVSSPSFADGAAIPSRFTCDGAGISPKIAWTGAPGGTQALALTVVDPEAGDFVHWLVYNIPGVPSGSLRENVGTGSGAPPQGLNSRGRVGYTGPCPPSGRHHYVFTLSALDGPLGLSGAPHRAELEAAMKGHVLATAVMTGTYQRH